MNKGLYGFLLCLMPLLFSSAVLADTAYTEKWYTNNEFPFYYTGKIVTGEHGVVIEGSQTGIAKGRPVNYALVEDRIWTDHLLSYKKVYGNTHFKIQLTAPKGSRCKIRIFVYGGKEFPNGTIKVNPY